ncbi:MAG: FkbM family methyltransferase [Burkholderiaceae bacterium]
MSNIISSTDDSAFMKLFKARHGYILINSFDSYIGRSIEHYGEWGEDEVALFTAFCEPGDQVIEVGSNIGTHTIALARKVGSNGRIHAFEPQRIVYQNLCANLSLNGILNVDSYLMAVGDSENVAYIPEINYQTPNNFGGMRVRHTVGGTSVRQIKLDDFLDLPSLKLLKVDAEDMELHVFNGAAELINRHQPYLYYENNPGNANQVALNAAVMSMGYTLYWHVSLLFSPNNYAGNPNNIFSSIASFNILGIPENKPLPSTSQVLKKISDPADAPF